MDATLLAGNDLVRPWRRATFLAAAVAAIELVALVGLGVALLSRSPAARPLAVAKPVAHHTMATRVRPQQAARLVVPPRHALRILVLNGNGRTGAAAQASLRLERLGYRIAAAANAARQNYSATLVMYAPGFRVAGLRLGHDVGARVVGPLDGLSRSSLHGGELAVILGA